MNNILKKFEELHRAIIEEETGNCKEAQTMYYNAKDNLDKAEEWILRGRRIQGEYKNGGKKDENISSMD